VAVYPESWAYRDFAACKAGPRWDPNASAPHRESCRRWKVKRWGKSISPQAPAGGHSIFAKRPDGLARLGGYTARKNDGPAGPKTLGLGWATPSPILSPHARLLPVAHPTWVRMMSSMGDFVNFDQGRRRCRRRPR